MRWNHLWLNEGLTTFFEWYGMEAVREKSFVWQKFYEEARRLALDNDWKVDFESMRERGPLVPTSEWIKTEAEAYAIKLSIGFFLIIR